MKLAPICLFTYNRLSETKLTVKALQKNYLAKESDLFIFSDGAKNESSAYKVSAVREYLREIDGFKSIIIYESKVNKGLADSIIDGVSKIINQYGNVIVLEDDLLTLPNFLDFMNQSLSFYAEEELIQSINGFSLSLKDKSNDVYFQTRPFSWGWGTWGDRWDSEIFDKTKILGLIDFDSSILKQFKMQCGEDIPSMLMDSLCGKNNSWYVRWALNHFISKRYSVYPSYSLVSNIGFGDNGTHCNGINSYKSEMSNNKSGVFDLVLFSFPSKNTKSDFLKYFSKLYKIIFRVKLLNSKLGRGKLMEEFKLKFDII